MTVDTSQSGGPANSGQADGGGSGGQGGVSATLFTQDQVNHFNAQARRGALESFFKQELGLDKIPNADELKQTFANAGEFAKIQDGQKNDVERLTGQLGEANKKAERVPVLEGELLRAQIAADAGLKSRYWKYVEGKTEDEIKASVKAVLDDVGSGEQNPEQGQGSGGRPPEPNPQQGRGGGQSPAKSMAAGAARYAEKHKKE